MPGPIVIDPYGSIVAGQSRHLQNQENASRYARFECDFVTTGALNQQYPDAVMFDCSFAQKPRIYTGMYVDSASLQSLTTFPAVTVGVSRWISDPNGIYTGAYVFFRVDTTLADLEIQHSFMFTGIAMKYLPAHLLDN